MDRASATNAALTAPSAQGLCSAIWTLAPSIPAMAPIAAQASALPAT